MKAFEFESVLSQDLVLPVPPQVASQVGVNEPVRVVLLVADDADAADWRRMTAEAFFTGYAPGDAIYDDLPAG